MISFDSSEASFDSMLWTFSGEPEDLLCGAPDELTNQVLALLPRGRAWQTHEGGPRPGSVLYGFWRSVAGVFAFANARLCALRAEFFCSTKRETYDLWLAEYGLPDECDPFPDLCAKVAAQGGAHGEPYRALAAAAGWDIECFEQDDPCGIIADCNLVDHESSVAGNAQIPATVYIRVHRATSPAYSGPLRGEAYADCFVVDGLLNCPPDISGLVCVLNRIVHAHVRIEYLLA